jgi:tetratricopeptide (TPR) repeat protein
VALKQVISETEHVIAIEQDLGGDSVFVTFNSIYMFRNGLQFWGDDFFLKQRISAIGIVTLGPNWYPRQAMDEVLAVVRGRIGGRKVITYGHGQGGYGALKYAAGLGASTTLSFCPQWSINPADVALFDTRFAHHFDESLANGLRIEQEDLCNRSFIFFDKMEKIDARHVAKLAALRGVRRVVAPFSMHETIRIVAQGRGAARLISLCTAATPPTAEDCRQVIRASRKLSHTYFEHMLHQLILRMSHSRCRSSAFVSGLLSKTKQNEEPFYSAIIAHAKGNAKLANSELAKTTSKFFDDVHLLAWWNIAHRLRFFNAERVVASQIFEKQSSNTVACLQALNTLIRGGDLESAKRELERLAKQSDAAKHVTYFLAFSVRLRRPEVVETLLSDALPSSARVLILFGLVDLYRELGNRSNAFRKLMVLKETCANCPADLRRVADCCIQLGEYSLALEIRERMLRNTPRDCLLTLDVVEARIPLNCSQALSELNEIMVAPDLSPGVWERASRLYERLGQEDAALRSISKAVALCGSGPDARHRLAALLARKGLTNRARDELVTLLEECRTNRMRLRAAGDLAFNLPDRELALKFAEAQFQCDPTDPLCILYLAHQLQVGGDRTRAQHLLASFVHVQRVSPTISDEQWIGLAQELYNVGDIALAKEAVSEAVAREPESAEACKLAATIALLEKFGKTVPFAPGRGDIPKQERLGFAARLTNIFRR